MGEHPTGMRWFGWIAWLGWPFFFLGGLLLGLLLSIGDWWSTRGLAWRD